MISNGAGFSPLVVPQQLSPWAFLHEEGRKWLVQTLLPAWLPTRRWFGGKARTVKEITLAHDFALGETEWYFVVVRVAYEDGAPDFYSIPLGCAPEGEIDSPELAKLAQGADGEWLHDATFSSGFRKTLLMLMRDRASAGGVTEHVTGVGSEFLDAYPLAELQPSKVLVVEQSNSSIIYGGKLFLKLFRRLQSGINPDAEITRFLTERQHFQHVPPFAGSLELHLGREGVFPAGLMLGCVENHGDAWKWALDELSKYYANGDGGAETFTRIASLGERTAQLHIALTGDDADPDFQPQPLTAEDFARLSAGVAQRLEQTFAALRAKDDGSQLLVTKVLACELPARDRISALANLRPGPAKTRHHGDYHLGQVLDTGTDWVIIDFEGEPLRSIAERRERRSPLRDVAGMLRSFHYAAHAARPDASRENLEKADAWARQAQQVYLDRYLAVAEGASFLPASSPDVQALLDAYVLEKALYEIDYELNNRPDWLQIPLRGLLSVVQPAQ